jgi:4-hydroxy-4-methyl-2-oxoglutarate aldolase
MYTVVREIARPSAAALDALRPFPTTILSDALGRYGAMAGGIQPVGAGMTVLGPAVTVRTYPADNLMIHLSLKIARPGDVIIVDADGFSDTAVLGDLVTACAARQGIAGIVLDGAIRDLAGLRAAGWPVFARGAVPSGPLKSGPGSINVPIACGGLVVHPGDIIVGDDDGVVVVPQRDWQRVAAAAQTIADKEASLRRRIADGEILWDIFDLDKVLATHPIEWS